MCVDAWLLSNEKKEKKIENEQIFVYTDIEFTSETHLQSITHPASATHHYLS